MIDLEKLPKPWKKALVNMPLDSVLGLGPLPEGVEIVQVMVKLYGEGLPEKFKTPEGEIIKWITPAQLAELAAGSST